MMSSNKPSSYLLDLVLYISVMFLVREIYFESAHFLANGLFWSFTTLVLATWRMRVRGVRWRDLGLCNPKSWVKCLLVSGLILGATIASIIVFEILKDQLPFAVAPDTSTESAVSRFGNLKDNWPLFFMIIPFVWLESMLEELLDRGFLMNWFERLFSRTPIAAILAVLAQAALFGFRHFPSHGWSGAITVSLIGLIMGAAYMLSGRNLWPLIIAHAVLNTISMVGRV
ncbi:MAG: CPBP family intramembrane metalloprotease [Acidobacteriota bacterium]|nr:CPBP family intramembrane metalloprotease [Acidobacteriota bacterium]